MTAICSSMTGNQNHKATVNHVPVPPRMLCKTAAALVAAIYYKAIDSYPPVFPWE